MEDIVVGPNGSKTGQDGFHDTKLSISDEDMVIIQKQGQAVINNTPIGTILNSACSTMKQCDKQVAICKSANAGGYNDDHVDDFCFDDFADDHDKNSDNNDSGCVCM